MHDDRKKDKTGTLALSQTKARAIGTGIGQSKKAALMTGEARAMRVADCIPESQKAAVNGTYTGYPAPSQQMDVYCDQPKMAAMQGSLAVRGRVR